MELNRGDKMTTDKYLKKVRCPICDGKLGKGTSMHIDRVGEFSFRANYPDPDYPTCEKCGAKYSIYIKFDSYLEITLQRVR